MREGGLVGVKKKWEVGGEDWAGGGGGLDGLWIAGELCLRVRG